MRFPTSPIIIDNIPLLSRNAHSWWYRILIIIVASSNEFKMKTRQHHGSLKRDWSYHRSFYLTNTRSQFAIVKTFPHLSEFHRYHLKTRVFKLINNWNMQYAFKKLHLDYTPYRKILLQSRSRLFIVNTLLSMKPKNAK